MLSYRKNFQKSNSTSVQQPRRLGEVVDQVATEAGEKAFCRWLDQASQAETPEERRTAVAMAERIAEKMGVYKEPEPPKPDGPLVFSDRMRRVITQQFNRLLPDTEESYPLLRVGSVEKGSTFHDVTFAVYRMGRLVKSLEAKQMTVSVDRDRDTIELRLYEGSIANSSNRREKIPIGEDGHSIFLRDVGVKAWLARSRSFFVDENGMLTWKTSPS